MADKDDDLLKPDEIENLLKSARGESPASAGGPRSSSAGSRPASSPSSSGAMGDLLSASEIDALLKFNEGNKSSTSPSRGADVPKRSTSPAMQSAEKLLDQAEADLAEALASDRNRPKRVIEDTSETRPFDFEEFPSSPLSGDGLISLSGLQDVELDLRIELGRTELLIEEVLQLKEGSVVPLDKLAGDPVDVLVNGRLIARGEVLVLNDNFCVRIAEIVSPDF